MGVDNPASYRRVFEVTEFRYLLAGNVLSLTGDQLANVALTFLVYDQTGSPALAAATFAASHLPWILGGPMLAAHADRWPRRNVLIVCDVVRTALVAVMVIPGQKPLALIALMFAVGLARTPFLTARAAMMPDIMDGDRYVVANGLDNLTYQATQVLGFAAGGAVVTLTSPRGALVLDALTFAASAALIAIGVRKRPAAAAHQPGSGTKAFVQVAKIVLADRRLRAYLLLFWLASAFLYAVEGLVAPLAMQYRGGPRVGGMLLAAAPLGAAVGGILLTRFCPPSRRARLIVPLAALSCAILVPVWWIPPMWALLGLLAIAGTGSAFAVPLNPIFGRAVATQLRGRAFGVAVTGLSAAQGLAMLAAGAAATHLQPTTVIAGSGMLGVLAVIAVATIWPQPVLPSRTAPPRSRHTAGR